MFLLTAFSPCLDCDSRLHEDGKITINQVNDRFTLFVAYNNVMSLKPTASILQQFDELAATVHE